MIVRGPQGGDIALAHRAGIAQTLPSPRKPFTPESHHQKVCRQPQQGFCFVCPHTASEWYGGHERVSRLLVRSAASKSDVSGRAKMPWHSSTESETCEHSFCWVIGQVI